MIHFFGKFCVCLFGLLLVAQPCLACCPPVETETHDCCGDEHHSPEGNEACLCELPAILRGDFLRTKFVTLSDVELASAELPKSTSVSSTFVDATGPPLLLSRVFEHSIHARAPPA